MQDNFRLFPPEVRFKNYIEALNSLPFHIFFINTLAYSFIATLGTVISCTIVGYGFARYDFRHKKILFGFLLSTIILPSVVLMVPSFLIFRSFGWIDTYLPLTVPAFFGLSAGSVFIIRQKIRTLPSVVFEAARIEGFNVLHEIRYIIIPEILPFLYTIGTLQFIWHWNDLIGPVIYINTYERKTLSQGLAFFQNHFSTKITLMMAASVIISIPTIIIFILNQKKIIRGVSLSDSIYR